MEQLDRIFFYHLDKAIRTYRQFAQARLNEKGFTITIDQWLVLRVLYDNPAMNQKELAEMVFKDKASITRIIEILVRDGFLNREMNNENRRRFKLTVTRKGEKLLKEIVPAVKQNRKQALKNLSEKEIKTAEKVLKEIITNCSK